MLLNSYKITRILPCIADPEKIRVIAEVSDEIQEVFPGELFDAIDSIGFAPGIIFH